VTYPLPEILVVALVGVVCEAEDWDEIAPFCEEKMMCCANFFPTRTG